VKFFNGVGVSTHKELALAPVIDKGVLCLSFLLEDEECWGIREKSCTLETSGLPKFAR
jgi:hypothetical protein